jgi:hypothetical protein
VTRRSAEKMVQAQIERIVSDQIEDIDCFVGHFPILRDPVDR